MTEILITSSVLIAVIALLRAVLKDRIRPGLQYALWGLVLLRLLVPVSWFESPVSVADAAEPIVRQVQQYSAENTRTVTFPVTMGEIPETGAPNEAVARTYIAPLDVVRLVWLGGTAVLAAWFLFVNVRLARKLSRERKIYSRTHKIPVYVTKTLPSPCLYLGDIYLTEEAAADPARAEYIIAHELTHRRHLDGLWSALRVVCLAVYWFNPLVWLAAVLSRRDCELFCDAATVKRLGEAHRFDYGRTLLDLTAVNIRPGDLICSATTMSGSGKSLKERIARIAQNRKTSVLLGAVVVLIAAIAVGCTFSGSETEMYFEGDPEISDPYATPEPVPIWEVLDTFTEDDASALYSAYLAADQVSFEAAEEYIWYDSEYTRQLSKENYQPLVYAAILDTQMLNDCLCAVQVELQSHPERPRETVVHYVGLADGRLYIFKNSYVIPNYLLEGLGNLELATSPTEEEAMYADGSYWDEVNEVFGPFLNPVDVSVYMSDYYTPVETSDLTLEEFVNMTDGWEFHYYDASEGLQLANDPKASIKISAEDGRALYVWNDAGIYICEGTSIITEITLGDMTGDEFFSYLYKWADSMAKPPVVIPDQFSGLPGVKKLPVSEAIPVLENPQYGVLGIFWAGHEGPYAHEKLLEYLTGCTMTPIHWTEDNLNLPPADWDILIAVDASPIIYLGVAEVGVPHYAVIIDGDDYIVCVLNNGSQIYEDVKAILTQSEAIPASPVSAATSYSPHKSASPTPTPVAVEADPSTPMVTEKETEPSEPASTPAPEARDPSIIPIADTPENLWGENWRDGLTEEQIARLESE